MKQNRFVIETPERVRFTYRIAESAARGAAFCIDAVIQLCALLVLLIPLLAGGIGSGITPFLGFIVISIFLVQWGYGFAFECFLSGRTPGKAALHLRVVRSDGKPLDAKSVALRNLLRAADGLPAMVIPVFGGFVSIADPWSRRLGDIVAGTIVVQDDRFALRKPPAYEPPLDAATVPIEIPADARLDERELFIIRKFLFGRASMPAGRADATCHALAEKVSARIGIERGTEDALAFVMSAYKTHIPVPSVSFAAERLSEWSSLEAMLKSAKRGGFVGDVARFVSRYRSACADLAAARGAGFAEDVVEYLNALVGEARSVLYSMPPLAKGDAGRALLEDFPRRILSKWRFILVSAVVFALPFFVSLAAAAGGGGFAERLLDPGFLGEMDKSYASIAFDGRSTPETSFMTSFYISNNVSIDFLTMATGIFFGTGSAFFLIENGLSLGGVIGHVYASGHGGAILRFVTAHAPFELGGLVLSGAAGLLLGWSVLRAGRRGRAESLRLAMDDFMPMAALASLLTFLAAFIEAGIGLSPLGMGGRIAIAAVCIACMLAYFVGLPLLSRRKGGDR